MQSLSAVMHVLMYAASHLHTIVPCRDFLTLDQIGTNLYDNLTQHAMRMHGHATSWSHRTDWSIYICCTLSHRTDWMSCMYDIATSMSKQLHADGRCWLDPCVCVCDTWQPFEHSLRIRRGSTIQVHDVTCPTPTMPCCSALLATCA